MVADIAISLVYDIILIGIGVICFLLILRRITKLIPPEVVKRGPWFTFLVSFSAILITAAIFLCLNLIISAITQNLLLASDGLLPGITREEFWDFLPTFNSNTAEAFINSGYVPIIRGLMLGFGIFYVLFETIFFSVHLDNDSKTKDYLLISRFLHINDRKLLNLVKAIVFCILIFGVFPWLLTEIVKLSPLNVHQFVLNGLNFPYFVSFPSEIIVSIYLSYFTVSFALLKLGLLKQGEISKHDTFNIKMKDKKPGIGIKIIATIFISLVIYKFILMWFILFNYLPENIYSNPNLFTSLFSFIIPDNNLLRIITVVLILFPIEITIFLLLQISFFFKRFFESELNTEKIKKPRDIFFICFIISGFSAAFAFLFKTYYPWLYVSDFMDASEFGILVLESQLFYPKIMIGIFSDFIFLILLLFQHKRVK